MNKVYIYIKKSNFTYYMKQQTVFIPDVGAAKTDNFSALYPILNHYIISERPWEESRDGLVKELLDFKTTITNPYKRCVGGYERDINIFFLLAEAIWIVLGRKDVEFLTIFNKRMADYSDDGKTFHAPYGWRLRRWGVKSEDILVSENLQANKGYDQILDAIRILTENPNSRQVVLSVWNPLFDLGCKSKDIPCNDMIMLKIREGKLITTIQNRSNDLHWGLTTNVFQFSFLTEIISSCLGIELGTQTHNSQSLHIYGWNKIAERMYYLYNKNEEAIAGSLYDDCKAKYHKMDFNFTHDVPINRFAEVEYYLRIICNNLLKVSDNEQEIIDEIIQLKSFSVYFYNVYKLLKIYIKYKKNIVGASDVEKEIIRQCVLTDLIRLGQKNDLGEDWDIMLLAQNFFAKRAGKNYHSFLGKL